MRVSAQETIGFNHCVKKCLADRTGSVSYKRADIDIAENEQSDRRCRAHSSSDISEGQFDMHVQSGVSLFGSILSDIFNLKLKRVVPERGLLISSKPPWDLHLLMDETLADIRRII